MSFERRAAFEQFRKKASQTRKPLPQKGFDPIRARLEKAIESDSSLIVEKVHFTSHSESLIEVVCTWVGLDAGQQAAVTSLKAIWTAAILGAEEEVITLDPQDDLVYLLFAGTMADNRFVTGKVLVRC